MDYLGFTIPDEWVVGYGLDYAEQHRTLPYIGALKPEALSMIGDYSEEHELPKVMEVVLQLANYPILSDRIRSRDAG